MLLLLSKKNYVIILKEELRGYESVFSLNNQVIVIW